MTGMPWIGFAAFYLLGWRLRRDMGGYYCGEP